MSDFGDDDRGAGGDEGIYEEDDFEEYYEPEENFDDDNAAPDDADNVVVSGDPSAAANALKSANKTTKEKKIPESERTTTPYMTKYERARILGTRALQIRYELHLPFDQNVERENGIAQSLRMKSCSN
jgi:DNA-directed RNA polymerase I, II, and III subunit RPABC2